MTYVFDNAAPHARARLSALAAVHDDGTIRQLQARGVAESWRCLEIGGGLGTITRWLSDRVGPRGHVVTTDIDTRFLDAIARANVEVWRHDILRDPLPDATFDLAYSRLVLQHLADPDAALDRMVKAIKPGGWLVVEDFEVQALGGSHAIAGLVRTLAAMRRVTEAAGADGSMGLSLGRRVRSLGLLHVGHEGRVQMFRGNTLGADLVRLNFEQLRESILATGLHEEDLQADLALLDDENFEWRSPTVWTAWGQRPGGSR
jgi:SAM-dependent methyltransferase